MEKNLDPNEFSTSIEELLKEDNDYESHMKRSDCDSESDLDNERVVTPVLKKKESKTMLDESEPCFMKNRWMREWFFTLKRDFVSKVLILSILFVLFTNPISVRLLQEYLPFCFTTGSVGYNTIGSFVLSCIFSVIYAFLALE